MTCPTTRIHPAIVAQAAATAAALMPGRFFLGVGTGENLNEHILGDRWPRADERREMLSEAVHVSRELWEGELVSFDGAHDTVDRARIYTLPEDDVPIVVAASGREAATLAGEIGNGLVSTAPERELVDAYLHAGGRGPRCGQLTVCWAESKTDARRTALEWWPNAGLDGPLSQELPLPSHFEEAAAMVTEDDVAEAVVCGPDLDAHLERIEAFADVGFDHVYVHRVGPGSGWIHRRLCGRSRSRGERARDSQRCGEQSLSSAPRRENRLGLDQRSRRDEPEQELVAELHRPDHRIVADHALVVDPPDAALDDRPLVVDSGHELGRGLEQARGHVLLDEADEVAPAVHGRAGPNLGDELGVLVDELCQFVERTALYRREPAAGEALARRGVRRGTLGDVKEYAQGRAAPSRRLFGALATG